MNDAPREEPYRPVMGEGQKQPHRIEIDETADLLHCARKGCGRSLLVGERRKRLKFGAQTRDSNTGQFFRICPKCWRKEQAR